MACSVFQFLQGPFWELTPLLLNGVACSPFLPTLHSESLTCASKEFPHHPLPRRVILILWSAAAAVLPLFPSTEQATPLGKSVSLIHFILKENGTPEVACDLPGLVWQILSGTWSLRELSWWMFLLGTGLCIDQQGPTHLTRVIVT